MIINTNHLCAFHCNVELWTGGGGGGSGGGYHNTYSILHSAAVNSELAPGGTESVYLAD